MLNVIEIVELLKQIKNPNSAKIKGVKQPKITDRITEANIEAALLEITFKRGYVNPPTTEEVNKALNLQHPKTKDNTVMRQMARKQIKKDLIQKSRIPAPGWFIREPNGSQASPDIRLCDLNGNILNIEAKAGKTAMFNSGMLQEDYFYVVDFESGTSYRDYGITIFGSKYCKGQEKLREVFDEVNNAYKETALTTFKITPQKYEDLVKAGLIPYARYMTNGLSEIHFEYMKNNKEAND